MRPHRISFVIPVYKNSETIEPLCAEIEATLRDWQQPCEFEIVLIDDCSPDDSWRVIGGLASVRSHVRGLRLAKNCGQHAAVLCGLTRAAGDLLVVLDADLQDPPVAVPALIQAIADADVIFAGRVNSYQSPGRMLTSKLYRMIILPLIGLPSNSGMFFVMKRPACAHLLRHRLRRPSVIGLIGAARLKNHSLPVGRRMRTSGRSSYSMLGRLRSVIWAVSTFAHVRVRRLLAMDRGAAWIADDLIVEDTVVEPRFAMSYPPMEQPCPSKT